jgi:hypothetical protein
LHTKFFTVLSGFSESPEGTRRCALLFGTAILRSLPFGGFAAAFGGFFRDDHRPVRS